MERCIYYIGLTIPQDHKVGEEHAGSGLRIARTVEILSDIPDLCFILTMISIKNTNGKAELKTSILLRMRMVFTI